MRRVLLGLSLCALAGVACGGGGGSDDADAAPASDGDVCAPGYHREGTSCVPDNECPDGCSGHGACIGRVCQCNEGYGGVGCTDCDTGWHLGADGRTCTQSLCDPNPCTAPGETCDESTGACCTTTDCVPPSSGLVVDQWGTDTSDVVWGVSAGASGEAIVVGETAASLDGQPHAGQTDLFVASRNTASGQNWTRARGTMYSDSARAVVRAGSGDIYVTGFAQGPLSAGEPTNENPFLSKWTAAGVHVWTRRWGSPTSDAAHGLARGTDGTFYVVGWTRGDMQGANAGELDAFLSKLDSNGDVLWSAQWGTPEDEIAMAVAVDAQGNAYSVGQTFGALDGNVARGRDAFLTKHNAAGEWQWTRQWGSGSSDAARAVLVAADGSVLVTGFANGELGRSGSGAVFLGAWDADGNERWIEQWGAATSVGRGLAVDATGAVIVAGRSGGVMDGAANAGGTDVFISKWTHSGATRSRVWSRQYGTAQDENAYSVAIAPSGVIYVAGETAGAFPGFTNGGQMLVDSFLLRIDPN